MEKQKKRFRLDCHNVVGAIHTEAGFLKTEGIDIAEVRVDLLSKDLTPADFSQVGCPIILTVRRRDEGGGREWSDPQREEIYRKWLSRVAAIDIELRSLKTLSGVVQLAETKRKHVIVSYHDFEKTPSLKTLRRIEAQGREAGISIVKIAAKTETPSDVARLLELLEHASGPMSVMGMGSLGKASRLLFAKAGSVLNYGWLDRPQVPGQWNAQEFAELLGRA